MNTLLAATATVSFAAIVYLGVYVLFLCQSPKKNYFLLCLLAASVWILGHLLELLSNSADEAYTAIRLFYLGCSFAPVLSFLFVADYCDVKLSIPWVKVPLILASLACVVLQWGTKYHGLVYTRYWFDDQSIHYLGFQPGAVYYMLRSLALGLLAASFVIILRRMRGADGKHRTQLWLLLFCAAAPIIGEGFNYAQMLLRPDTVYIYIVPHLMALSSLLFYIAVMRYDMLDIVPKATMTAMSYAKEAYILLDEQGRYLYSNRAASVMFADIISLSRGAPIAYLADWPPSLHNLAAQEGQDVPFTLYQGDAARYYQASVNVASFNQGQVDAYVVLMHDVTESVSMFQQLEEAAYTDALTGLYNRRHFLEMARMYLDRATRSQLSSYVMMLDLDHFKLINDQYLHPGGDAVLRAVAGHMREAVRTYDVVARYGGEEFLLLLTEIEQEPVMRLAERLRVHIADTPILFDGYELRVTCSIGVALYKPDEGLDEAICQADKAMYRAKAEGRNRVCLYAST
ncbi:MAG: diguanylate cyclase [Oscillospiraceae bacterium]|jgi:diguanylate cyclase (GGDEF)-like protein|nr:diguanylate cyclase [Oscillospiraceae bacterium]